MKINNIEDLFAHVGVDTFSGLERAIYKGTDCGAWIAESENGIRLGSIVEGSDVEVGPVEINYPFESDDMWSALEEINNEASFYWERDNADWLELYNGDQSVFVKWGHWDDKPEPDGDCPAGLVESLAAHGPGNYDSFEHEGWKCREVCNDCIF